MGLVRGMGVGVDFSTQRGDVHPAILSNTASKCVMRCGSATDYDVIGSAMGLTTEQRQWLSVTLSPGACAVQVGEGSWRHPFLAQLPPMRLTPESRGTSRNHEPFADLPFEAATEFANWRPQAEASRDTPQPSSPSASATTPLSEAEARYLRAVLQQPGQASSVYTRLSRMSSKRAQVVRDALIKRGYLKAETVNAGSGRPSIILHVLPAGEAALVAQQNGSAP